jgi:hypothetical protein
LKIQTKAWRLRLSAYVRVSNFCIPRTSSCFSFPAQTFCVIICPNWGFGCYFAGFKWAPGHLCLPFEEFNKW